MQPTAPAAPTGRPDRRLTLGDGIAAFGGLLVFAFSFAPFVAYDSTFQQQLTSDNLPTWFSAWSAETFMGPLTWFVVLAGLLTIGLAAAHLAWTRGREVLGFRIGHVQVGVALFAFLVTFGYATSDKDVVFGHDLNVSLGQAIPMLRGGLAFSFGWGGYLMLLGTVLCVAGAILSYLEVGPVLYPQPPHPQPVGAYPPPPHQWQGGPQGR